MAATPAPIRKTFASLECRECGGLLGEPYASHPSRCRPCVRAARAKYVARNHEKVLAQKREHHHANKARLNAQRRVRSARATDARPARRLADPAVAERHRARARAWRADPENRLKVVAQAARRRARKAAAPGRVSGRDVERLVRRFGGMCAYCGQVKYEHIDHVVPLSRGGSNHIGNLLPACGSCNQRKGTRFLVQFRIKGE